jgi:hypothetical protein
MARSAIVCFLAATGLLAGCGRAETAPVAAPDARAVAVSERLAGTIVFASDENRLTTIDVATGRRTSLRVRAIPAGDLLVGCPQDSHCDDVAIVDTRTGRTVMARAGGRYQLDVGGTFSPDGSLLATGARAGRRWRVALVDARSGTHTIVRGSRTGKMYPELAWARSSGWLFIRAGGRVKAYRPGARRAATLPFELPATTIAFAVA